MTAALELAGFSPEVVEALVDHLAAKLSLVPPPASTGLSILRKSIDRRNCERRQADAVRGDRSGDGLSKIPTSVRRREWARRQAAAKKARIDRDRSPPLDLQPVNTEKSNSARSPSDRSQSGPLAGAIAQVVDRASSYADSTRKRDRAWLYREAARIFGEELGLRLPECWSGPKDWGAAKVLVRDWKPEELLVGIKTTCAKWKLAPGRWSRPTLGLVLFHLKQDRLGPAPAARTDPRRLTGEQLEHRDRSRAAAAHRTIPEPQPPRPSTASASTCSAGTPPTIGEPREAAARPAGSDGCAAGTTSPAPAPLQLAEPSPTSSAAALAVLELVNETAAKCRAFKRRGGAP
jgi:hypothetical protein